MQKITRYAPYFSLLFVAASSFTQLPAMDKKRELSNSAASEQDAKKIKKTHNLAAINAVTAVTSSSADSSSSATASTVHPVKNRRTALIPLLSALKIRDIQSIVLDYLGDWSYRPIYVASGEQRISAFACSPDGRYIALAGRDTDNIVLLDAKSFARLKTFDLSLETSSSEPVVLNQQPVPALNYSAATNTLPLTSMSSCAHTATQPVPVLSSLTDIFQQRQTALPIIYLESSTSVYGSQRSVKIPHTIKHLVFAPDSTYLIVAGEYTTADRVRFIKTVKKYIQVFAVSTGTRIAHDQAVDDISDMAISTDNKLITVRTQPPPTLSLEIPEPKFGLRIRDAKTLHLIKRMCENSFASTCAYAPNNRYFACRSYATGTTLWNAHTHESMRNLIGTGYESALAISPDSKKIAHVSEKDTGKTYGNEHSSSPIRTSCIEIWDADSGELLHEPSLAQTLIDAKSVTISEQSNCRLHEVYSLAFSPDGNYFAALVNNCIRIWETQNYRVIAQIERERSKVYGFDNCAKIAFSADSSELLATDGAARLIVWKNQAAAIEQYKDEPTAQNSNNNK